MHRPGLNVLTNMLFKVFGKTLINSVPDFKQKLFAAEIQEEIIYASGPIWIFNFTFYLQWIVHIDGLEQKKM